MGKHNFTMAPLDGTLYYNYVIWNRQNSIGNYSGPYSRFRVRARVTLSPAAVSRSLPESRSLPVGRALSHASSAKNGILAWPVTEGGRVYRVWGLDASSAKTGILA